MNRAANVLLAEADGEFVRLATGALSRAGHRLVAVDRGATALERLRAQAFDLAIIGLRLPDTGGIELLEAMKTASPETPVVIVAADPGVDAAIAALRKGAYDFLRRPVAEEDLLAVAEKAAQ
ncbi:MAG TPA: response regulator, partial [Candidatus Polarisedimenticolia bacterium]|nr:response regulator [Candidatus Polarisedimenticolia bacterium]